jgi:hypothetical protein
MSSLESGTAPARSLLSRIDSAVWILLLTALAYAIAFGYECGYLASFGIPAELAEVDLREALVCGAAALGAFSLLCLVAPFLNAPLPRVPERLWRDNLFFVFLVVGAWAWFHLAKRDTVFSSIVPWTTAVLGLCVIYVLPLWEHRELEGYWAKLCASLADRQRRLDLTLEGKEKPLFERFNPYIILLIALAIASPFGAFTFGESATRDQVWFLVPVQPGAPKCVVVRSGSSGLLCATYQPKTHVLCDEYRFLKVENSILQQQAVGPLVSLLGSSDSRSDRERNKDDISLQQRDCVADATAQTGDSGSQPIDIRDPASTPRLRLHAARRVTPAPRAP